MSQYRMALTLVALSLAFAATENPAQAQGARQVSFVIENPYNAPLIYQVQWGNGEWKEFTVAPNGSWAHYIQVNNNGAVPTPRIRFDNIAGDGQYTETRYTLDAFGVNNPWNGKRYVFSMTGARGVYINLHSK